MNEEIKKLLEKFYHQYNDEIMDIIQRRSMKNDDEIHHYSFEDFLNEIMGINDDNDDDDDESHIIIFNIGKFNKSEDYYIELKESIINNLFWNSKLSDNEDYGYFQFIQDYSLNG